MCVELLVALKATSNLRRRLYAMCVELVALKATSHLRRGLYAMCVELIVALKPKSHLVYKSLAKCS